MSKRKKIKKLKWQLSIEKSKATRYDVEADYLFAALKHLWDTGDTDLQEMIEEKVPNMRSRLMFYITNEIVKEWYAPQLKQQMERRETIWDDLKNSEKITNSDGESRVVFNVRTPARPGCAGTSSP